jgi:hypothetical protein
MPEASTELARRFVFVSSALAEEFDSALKLGGSWRRFFEMADESQQLLQLVFVQLFDQQGLLRALVLERDLVGLTICFSARIHHCFSVSAVELISDDAL